VCNSSQKCTSLSFITLLTEREKVGSERERSHYTSVLAILPFSSESDMAKFISFLTGGNKDDVT